MEQHNIDFRQIRLVALDMDGTLLDSKKRLPTDFVSWVSSHPSIKTAIASGRQYFTLLRDFESIQDRLTFIAENGSVVYEKGKLIYSNPMKKEDIKEALQLITKIPEATPILCGISSAYIPVSQGEAFDQASLYYAHLKCITNLDDAMNLDTIIKVAVYFEKATAEHYFPLFSSLPEQMKTVLSGLSWVDVSNRDADKGNGIKAIQKEFGITREESMAFGDYLNDTEMLKAVKYSVAMGNSHPDILQLCALNTASNDEDGVMKILRQF